MAEFTWTPDFGAQKEKRPAVKMIKFGDGYESRQAFGINTNLENWNLTFKLRENSEADEIEDFLDARAGVESFDWEPPYAAEPRRFVCREWTRSPEKADRSTITAKFEEVSEPSV